MFYFRNYRTDYYQWQILIRLISDSLRIHRLTHKQSSRFEWVHEKYFACELFSWSDENYATSSRIERQAMNSDWLDWCSDRFLSDYQWYELEWEFLWWNQYHRSRNRTDFDEIKNSICLYLKLKKIGVFSPHGTDYWNWNSCCLTRKKRVNERIRLVKMKTNADFLIDWFEIWNF